VLDAMARAAATGNVDSVLDHGDTLLMLIQQHNLKEEGMLYPMAERALGGAAWGPIAEAIGQSYGR
jgi:iron-sulfur cluster repair protein YtfE (RIC family)